MVDLIDSAVKKNKTLASWTKERIERVSQMTIMWDNLQSLLSNQQMLIAKQVICRFCLFIILIKCMLSSFQSSKHISQVHYNWLTGLLHWINKGPVVFHSVFGSSTSVSFHRSAQTQSDAHPWVSVSSRKYLDTTDVSLTPAPQTLLPHPATTDSFQEQLISRLIIVVVSIFSF